MTRALDAGPPRLTGVMMGTCVGLAVLAACPSSPISPRDAGGVSICDALPPDAGALCARLEAASACFDHQGGCSPDGGPGASCGKATVTDTGYLVQWPDGASALAAFQASGAGAFFYELSGPGSTCVRADCCSFHVCGPAHFNFPDGVGFDFAGRCSELFTISGDSIDAGQLSCFPAITFCGVTDAGRCLEKTVSPQSFVTDPSFPR